MPDCQIKTMWLSLSLCDGEGQFVRGIALEVHAVSLYGLEGKDMVLDLIHTDGEYERIRLKAQPANAGWTLFFKLGSMPDYVAGVRMTGEFPANLPISKEAFRRRCGTGMLLNESGHFIEVGP